MARLLPSYVQGRPFAIPVKGYCVFALVYTIKFLKIFVFDSSGSFFVEQAECNFVLGVWLSQQVFEDTVVGQVYTSSLPTISNTEEYGILFSFYLVL